jgi:hypothetical protein
MNNGKYTVVPCMPAIINISDTDGNSGLKKEGLRYIQLYSCHTMILGKDKPGPEGRKIISRCFAQAGA